MSSAERKRRRRNDVDTGLYETEEAERRLPSKRSRASQFPLFRPLQQPAADHHDGYSSDPERTDLSSTDRGSDMGPSPHNGVDDNDNDTDGEGSSDCGSTSESSTTSSSNPESSGLSPDSIPDNGTDEMSSSSLDLYDIPQYRSSTSSSSSSSSSDSDSDSGSTSNSQSPPSGSDANSDSASSGDDSSSSATDDSMSRPRRRASKGEHIPSMRTFFPNGHANDNNNHYNNSDLGSRLEAFLPQMASAWEELEQERREGRLGERNMEISDEEDTEGGDTSEETDEEDEEEEQEKGKDNHRAGTRSGRSTGRYIEMNLGLGVLEEKSGREHKRRRQAGWEGSSGDDTGSGSDGQSREEDLPPLVPQRQKKKRPGKVKIETID